MLAESAARVLGVIAWPVVFLVALHRFGPRLADFLATLSEISVKGGGVEASAKRMAAAAALGAAIGAKDTSDDNGGSSLLAPRDSSAVAQALAHATPRAIRDISNARVLWVDDKPESNRFERQALEALGIHFALSTSTADALQRLQSESFDAVISDIRRPDDPRAGFTLLEQIRPLHLPTIIYTGTNAAKNRAEAVSLGAVGCTSRPDDLVKLLLHALTESVTA